LVRIFCSVIQALVLPVFHAPQDLALRCTVTCQLVSDDHAWRILAAFEEFAEELPRCCLIPSALDQDI